MWDGITYPFPNINSATIEVWEWISNFIPHIVMDVITYACWLVKGAPGVMPHFSSSAGTLNFMPFVFLGLWWPHFPMIFVNFVSNWKKNIFRNNRLSQFNLCLFMFCLSISEIFNNLWISYQIGKKKFFRNNRLSQFNLCTYILCLSSSENFNNFDTFWSQKNDNQTKV